MPLTNPLCRWLGDEPVLVVEIKADGSCSLYRNGSLKELPAAAAARLTDKRPPKPESRSPGLCLQNAPLHLQPLIRARIMARDDEARERLAWRVAKLEELPALIEATLRAGNEVPSEAWQRLAQHQSGLKTKAAAKAEWEAVKAERKAQAAARKAKAAAKPQPSPAVELQRTHALRQRQRHVAEADVLLGRVSINVRIDWMLAQLWSTGAAASAPAAADPQPPRLLCEQGSALAA